MFGTDVRNGNRSPGGPEGWAPEGWGPEGWGPEGWGPGGVGYIKNNKVLLFPYVQGSLINKDLLFPKRNRSRKHSLSPFGVPLESLITYKTLIRLL